MIKKLIASSVAMFLSMGCASSTVRETATDSSPPVVKSAPVPRGVVLNTRSENYVVQGNDARSISASLQSLGPVNDGVRSAGYHRWSLNWKYQSRMDAGQCAVSSVTITLESTITLPVWEPTASASADLRTDWNDYAAALSTHEVGHRSIVLAGAGKIRNRLMDVRAMTCSLLEATMRSEVTELIAQIRKENELYDSTTRKGTTQGAVWPRRISAR
jgi:predicted secreted Zn-dependent protease